MTQNWSRVLVAGATGYLGGFVSREFKKRGYFVRALARSASKLKGQEHILDEVVEGEVTVPNTLQGICSDIDVVFSSLGITKQPGKLTFKDVDYQGNKNLLEEAVRAGVKKFVYVSVFDGPQMTHLAIVKAHEDFVQELRKSGMESTIVRPTGFFSDMAEYLKMAKKGRAYLFGSGRSVVNPIHGEDLAVVCVDAVEGPEKEKNVGGPQVMSHREIAETAFRSLGRNPKVSSIPLWAIMGGIAVTRLFNRHQAELLAFFLEATTNDMVAPAHGVHTVESHFEDLNRPR